MSDDLLTSQLTHMQICKYLYEFMFQKENKTSIATPFQFKATAAAVIVQVAATLSNPLFTWSYDHLHDHIDQLKSMKLNELGCRLMIKWTFVQRLLVFVLELLLFLNLWYELCFLCCIRIVICKWWPMTIVSHSFGYVATLYCTHGTAQHSHGTVL